MENKVNDYEENYITGYVSLFRSFINWEWFTEPNMVTVFIYCLLKANFKDNRWKGIEIKKGSFITSYSIISKDTGLSLQNVRTCIKKLVLTKELTSEPTSKYTLLTVVKYSVYQQKNNEANTPYNKQLTSDQQSTNNQLTTTNKDNNINKDNKQQKDVVDFEVYKNKIAEEGNSVWIEGFYMTYKLKPKTLSFIVDDFILHLKCQDETKHPKNLKDFKKYLYNWCNRIEPEGKLNQYKKNQPKQAGQL